MTTTDPAAAATWHEESLRRDRFIVTARMVPATPDEARECAHEIASIDNALAAFGYERADNSRREAA